MRCTILAATCALALLATTHPICAQPDAAVQSAAKLSPDEQKIETALAKKIKLSYHETPLKDVIADMAKQADVAIELDPEGLEEAGVAQDQLVNLELGTFGLRQGLEVLLESLNLDFTPGVAGLTITSEEINYDRTLTRVYPVGDLVRVHPEPGGEIAFDFDTLIDTLTANLTPDAWTDNGGSGSIEAGPANCLVVSQSYPMHREVEQMLMALRQLKSDAASLKPGEVGRIISLTHANAVRDALAKRDSTTLDSELKFYLQDVAKVIAVPVIMDPEGLDEAGVTPDQMIHAAYRDARIGEVFRETLKKLHLTSVIKDGYVVVTSEEKASEIGKNTRIYPVGDLAPLRAIQDPPVRDFDALIDLITSSSEHADVWVETGGTSSISGWFEPAALIVTTTDEVHDTIEQLLTTLRESGVAEFNAEQAKADQRIVERVYPLYAARRQQRAKAAKADKPVEEIPSADDVAKLIEELLPEISWKEEGVVLRPFHDRLIIRHRPALLHKVEKLLQKIDAWPHQPPPLPVQGGGGMSGGFF